MQVSISNKEDLVNTLSFFGLEKTDGEVYLGLLQMGAITVGNMAAKLEIDRGKAYRSINKLRSLGMISTTFSNPSITTAIEPKEALTQIIQKKEDELTTMEKLATKLSKELEDIKRPIETINTPFLSVIQGRSNIYARICKVLRQSSKNIYFVTTADDLVRMYHTAVPELMKSLVNNGIEIRLVTNSCDERTMSLIKRIGLNDIRIGKLPSKSRIFVENEKHLIMSGSINETSNMNDDVDSILYTNSIEMVNNMFSLCSHLWKKSKPLEIISK